MSKGMVTGGGDSEEMGPVMQSIFQQSKKQQVYLKENEYSENKLD